MGVAVTEPPHVGCDASGRDLTATGQRYRDGNEGQSRYLRRVERSHAESQSRCEKGDSPVNDYHHPRTKVHKFMRNRNR
jgi:hypothetical protein